MQTKLREINVSQQMCKVISRNFGRRNFIYNYQLGVPLSTLVSTDDIWLTMTTLSPSKVSSIAKKLQCSKISKKNVFNIFLQKKAMAKINVFLGKIRIEECFKKILHCFSISISHCEFDAIDDISP